MKIAAQNIRNKKHLEVKIIEAQKIIREQLLEIQSLAPGKMIRMDHNCLGIIDHKDEFFSHHGISIEIWDEPVRTVFQNTLNKTNMLEVV